MKKIYTTFAFLLLFAGISTAQISISTQYSHDFRQSNSAYNPGLYNYYQIDYLIDCFNCGAYNYYGEEEYKRLQNYNYGLNIRYKKKRFAAQLGMVHAIRDFRIQVIEVARDDSQGLIWAYDQWTGSPQNAFPVAIDDLDNYGIMTYEQRYLGISPEVQFFWANYDQFSSYIGIGTSFYELLTSDAGGQIFPVQNTYSTFHATFGFEQRIGQHFFVNFGGKYQHGNKDYAGDIEEDYTLNVLSAFLGLGYSL